MLVLPQGKWTSGGAPSPVTPDNCNACYAGILVYKAPLSSSRDLRCIGNTLLYGW
jgi:hypothetical protein